jgi:hypothetical protein
MMKQFIAAMSPFLGVISLIGIPIAVASTLAFNNNTNEVAETHKPGPHYDLHAARIVDMNHPFWQSAVLIKQCPSTHEFLYKYNEHKYIGVHDSVEGVVELDDQLNEDGVNKLCH